MSAGTMAVPEALDEKTTAQTAQAEIASAQMQKATQAGELVVGSAVPHNGMPGTSPSAAPGVAPSALPTQLGPFNASNITFNNGVPVGGFAQLTLHSNGQYSFTGHFHDSGAVGYNDELAWVVVDASGVAYTFKHSGHMGGTFTSGSRDDNWNVNGTNPAIANGWSNLCRSYRWRWQASVNWDVASTLDAVIAAIKAAGPVVTTIIAIV